MAAYIYMIRATRPEMLKTGLNEHEMAAYQAHVAYFEELTRKGVLLLAGRTQIQSIGIAIIHADSDAEAEAIMNADPFVARGVVTPTLEPFSLAAGTALR
jgi:uncharacterized protein YciI